MKWWFTSCLRIQGNSGAFFFYTFVKFQAWLKVWSSMGMWTSMETFLLVLKFPSSSLMMPITTAIGPLNMSHLVWSLSCQLPVARRTRARTRKPPALQWLTLAPPSAGPTCCLAEHLCSADSCWLIVLGGVFLTEA